MASAADLSVEILDTLHAAISDWNTGTFVHNVHSNRKRGFLNHYARCARTSRLMDVPHRFGIWDFRIWIYGILSI